MTSVPTIATPSASPATDPPRLRLRPPGALTGHVDGAWWPRSRDLAAELPELLAAIAAQMQPVGRVSYHPADWDPAPRRVVVGAQSVRLGWYRLMPAGTVDVISGLRRITLIVVPAETPADVADDLLSRAANPANVEDVATLLEPSVASA
jgi:hypothetical protein